MKDNILLLQNLRLYNFMKMYICIYIILTNFASLLNIFELERNSNGT